MAERRKPIETTCVTCGNTFKAHQCKLENGFRKFCSVACRNESNGFRRMVWDSLPSTASKLCEKFNLPNRTIQRILKRGVESGVCHIVKLVRIEGAQPKNCSPYEFHFGVGPKPMVSTLPSAFKEAHRILLRHIVLGAMPGIQSEIRKTTGLSQASVCVAIQELRNERRCYITTWKRQSTGGAVAVFRAGKHKDAECRIKNFTRKEIMERYIKKMDKDELEDYRRKAANRQALRARRLKGDPFVNALFGKPSDRLKEAA